MICRRLMLAAVLAAVLAPLVLAAPAHAGLAKIKGLHDDHERPSPLIRAPKVTLDTPGRVFAVIGGDYGFRLYDGNGTELRFFADSQDAVGLELAPGTYQVIPSIDGDLHHHQFIEVLIRTE